MPRYYFDLRDRSGALKDEIGEELENDAAARKEAVRAATAIARDTLDSDGSISVEVRKDAARLFTVVLAISIASIHS